MRGEYQACCRGGGFVVELPPRARRILANETASLPNAGTTSACAENTFCPTLDTRAPRNYLRVRGEYTMADRMDQYLTELPPRARRILGKDFLGDFFIGTTSACAENTLEGRPETLIFWNYLRVRGEYRGSGGLGCFSWELPPRARRIREKSR